MKYKFEDIIFNITEKKKPVEEDKYNYIGLEHLESGNLFISKWGSDTAPEGEKIVMKKGDVLFGKRRAYQKKVAISPIDGIFSAHGMVLRPKEDVICKEFLPFFISSETFLNEAIRISVGGLSPTVNWKDIKELEFYLPSLAEQKVLAEKLWAAYEVKQSYLKMIAATEEMVKSQFIEMFANCSEKDILSNIVLNIKTGKLNANAADDGGAYPFYTCDETPKKINDYAFDTEAILVSGNGSQIGHLFYYKGKFNAYQRTYVLSDFSDKIDVQFLFNYFKIFLKPYIMENCIGSAIPYITLPMLEKFVTPTPSNELQKKFVSIAEQADKSISELRKSVDAIDKVIKSLINENL